MNHRPTFGTILVLVIAVGVAAAACGVQPDGFAARSGRARSWAPLPEAVPMPAGAPDDPAAYRGVRYRIVHQPGAPGLVEVEGRPVSWLQSSAWGYQGVGGADGPYFGHQEMFDGRRRMLWFFRLVEPPVPVYGPTPPPPLPVATTAPPPRPGSALPRAAAAFPPTPPPPPPPQAVGPAPPPPDPPARAVLDVVVVSGGDSGFRMGCGGPDTVIIDGGNGWRLNQATGRIEPTDPDDANCPDD